MAYWWLLERKNFKDEPIKLTPSIGEKAQFAWLNGQEKIFLPHLKIAIDSTDIKGIGPSTQVMRDEGMYQLASGLDLETKPYGKGKAVMLPDYEENGIQYKGAVMTNWYKKNVDKREWDGYYSKCPWYLRIDDSSGACWIAMLLPEENNSDKPSQLVLCDANEQKYLTEKSRQ